MKKSQSNEELIYIKLNLLTLSLHNVRTAPASKEDDRHLKASIKAQGITQCLVVIKEGDHYAVIAGGRRLTQLNHLVDEGSISKDYLVPCLLKEGKNICISAVSLSENIKAKMHPADEFIAFARMIDEGKTVVAISHEFGVTQKLVKERLKMATLAPVLINYYRAGKIDLQDVMAFTLSDDHQRQLECYKQLSPHSISPYRIKQYLLDQAISTNEAIVKCVTVQRYRKAGGTMTTDLFESASYIDDKDLLETLATARLEEKAKPLRKQWKWVDIALSPYCNNYESTLTAEPMNVPDDLCTTIKEKEGALATLNAINYNELTEEQEKQEEQLDSDLDKLHKKLDKYRRFTPEQKKVAGAIVKINHDGGITVCLGLVKHEDMPLAFPTSDKATSTTTTQPDTNACIESQALMSDLKNYRLQALQSHLLKDEKIAYDLMVFSTALSIFSSKQCTTPIAATLDTANYHSTNDINETKAAKLISDFKESLALGWVSHSSNAEKFTAFQQLSSSQKKRLFTYCTALSYHMISDINGDVADRTNFVFTHYWQPTADNYYKRITTKGLLNIGETEIGQDWLDKHKVLSKGQLVVELSEHDNMKNWVPACVR